jgi:spermidine/putrescine transport system ATP-binding protein
MPVTPRRTITVLDTKTHLSVEARADNVNAVPVKAIGDEFAGATATVNLETAQGREIRLQKGHDELANLPLGIGQNPFAWRNPEDAHLVAEV